MMQHKSLNLSASVLAADLSDLGADCRDAMAAGVDSIHFDVMDGHFVPNLSFGAPVAQSLRQAGVDAPIDAHLMVDSPEAYVAAFAKAKVDLFTFHPETTDNLNATIDKVLASGMRVGLAFNPEKPVDIDAYTLSRLHMILLMSVHPGFSGQHFIESVYAKIESTASLIQQSGHEILLGVDGGVNADNAKRVIDAGANFLVMGSGFFATPDWGLTVQAVRQHA